MLLSDSKALKEIDFMQIKSIFEDQDRFTYEILYRHM